MLPHVRLEHLEALLLTEGPRFIFPFARSTVADVTREGGFPPLALDPIDFAQLFRQQMQAQQEAGAKERPDA